MNKIKSSQALLGAKQAAFAVTMLVLFSSASAADQCDSVLLSTQPEVLAKGFQYTEGPTWDKYSNRFVFSDIPANTIFGITTDGQVSTVVKPSGYANGNAIDADGNIWSARHDRKIGKTDRAGKTVVVAEAYAGKRLNSPNDLVVAKDGSVIFTDPPFGIQGYGPEKADEEQTVRGIYRLKDGEVSLLSGELKLPNGLAFSNDGKKLFVGDTADGYVYSFTVTADGKLTNKARFARVEPTEGKAPMVDGVRVDHSGNVWMTGPEGIGVFSPAGAPLCKVDLPGAHVSNLAFGGADGRDVLITYSDKILRLRARAAGI
jgi:gluconolactonase